MLPLVSMTHLSTHQLRSGLSATKKRLKTVRYSNFHQNRLNATTLASHPVEPGQLRYSACDPALTK